MKKLKLKGFLTIAMLFLGTCLTVQAQSGQAMVDQSIKNLASSSLNYYELAFEYYDGKSEDPVEQKVAYYTLQKDFQSLLFEFEDQTTLSGPKGLIQVDKSENFIAYDSNAKQEDLLGLGSMGDLRNRTISVEDWSDQKEFGNYWSFQLSPNSNSFQQVLFWIGKNEELLEITMVYDARSSGPQPPIELSPRMSISFKRQNQIPEGVSQKMRLSNYIDTNTQNFRPTKEFADYELFLL